MAWLAMPETERRPRFQRDLASVLGVHETTLSEWKRLPGFGSEVVKLSRELIRATDVARIVQVQVVKALAGDNAAARFVLDFAAAWPDGSTDASDSLSAGAAAGAQASASAIALSVAVTGADVDEDTARRVGARKLLQQFTVSEADS
jgi:hypothetical protein